jgi:tyrosinase
MASWTSAPLAVTSVEFARVDLIFNEVDHSGPSYAARVFVDNPEAHQETPLDAATGYAGSFHVFGHGGCFGEAGHCDIPTEPLNEFDRRWPHPLTPQRKTVIATDAIRRAVQARGARKVEVVVSVVAVARDAPGLQASTDDPLKFERLTLATYE